MSDFLYKYRSITDANRENIEKIFIENRIYFPSPSQFNDPFDCAIQLSLAGSDDEWRKYILNNLKRNVPSLKPAKRLVHAHRLANSGKFKDINPEVTTWINRKIGIYCLSAVKNNILMWSHYANSHTGFVLEFRSGERDLFFRRALPVRYSKDYPATRIFDSDVERMEASVLTKSSHWLYEHEYRILEHRNGPGEYEYPPELLTGVILGFRMSEKDKEQLIEWASKHPGRPQLYQAHLKEREFGLDIKPLP